MRELPKQILIGNVPYDVELVEGFIEVDNMNKDDVLIGAINYTKQQIKISDETKNEIRHKVLIHEITHGILEEYGMTRHNKEDFVDRLGAALYDFLMRNDLSFLQRKEEIKRNDSFDSFQYALRAPEISGTDFFLQHRVKSARRKAAQEFEASLSAVREVVKDEKVKSRPRRLPINNERSLHVPLAELTGLEEEAPDFWETGIKVRDGVNCYKTRYTCPECRKKGNHYVPEELEAVECHSCNEKMQKIPATTEGFPQRDGWGNFFVAGEVQQYESGES